MNDIFEISGKWSGSFRIDYLPKVNYSVLYNNIDTCNLCELENNSSVEWTDISVTLTGETISRSESHIDNIPIGERIQLVDIKIQPSVDSIINMTEAVETSFKVSVSIGEDEVLNVDLPLCLMTFSQWPGTSIHPELLSAFVTPNHPSISHVIVNASKYMEKWTGSSAMDEYQTQDRNRARMQVAALFHALREESLVYAAPPANFELYGQRIRLSDQVLSEKIATCLDSTLLFASCAESIGLFPIVVLMKGHAFAGVWLTNDIYDQSIGDDASFLLKKCADGLNDIVLVETTMLTTSSEVQFEDAVNSANSSLKKEEQFNMFVDIHRCRLGNIRPLPQRIEADGKWKVVDSGAERLTSGDVKKLDHFALSFDTDKKVTTKQMIWERKLLDFSLRNNLINAKPGKKAIQFLSFEIEHLEDALQCGDNFLIQPYPNSSTQSVDGGLYDSHLQSSEWESLVTEGLSGKKLYSYLPENDLRLSLKNLYRSARVSMEENGANSLFLTLGLLKWYETEKSVQPRYAPLLLMPVDLVRRQGSIGYAVRSRGEEIIFNTTLAELLKQQFNVNTDMLSSLPTDEHGIDVKRVFAIVRHCIGNLKRWNLLEESMIGLFSFSKFVMWNDIHTNAVKLKQNPVIAALMDNKQRWHDGETTIDAREVDKNVKPQRYAVPLDADSSQMEAIIEAGDGKSFVLHGPPGTGKSQTIANLISNALYQGKRVLFVAEKMAALEVVQKRLSKIGVDPFCLELHSNKVTKQHFLAQMQKALDVIRIQSPESFDATANSLYENRQKIIGNIEALHKKRHTGLSLYDCITRYSAIKSDEINDGLPNSSIIIKERIDVWKEEISSLDAVFNSVGHPAGGKLKGLEPNDTRIDLVNRLRDMLTKYRSTFVDVKQQVESLSNVMFGQPTSDSVSDIESIVKLASALQMIPVINADLFKLSTDNDRKKVLAEALIAGRKRDLDKAQLLKNCADSILNLDGKTLRLQWEALSQKWFLPRFLGRRAFIRNMRKVNPSLQTSDVDRLLQLLEDYNLNKGKVTENRDVLSLFSNIGKEDREDWTKIEQVNSLIPSILQTLSQLTATYGMSLSQMCDLFLKNIGEDVNLFRQQQSSDLKKMTESYQQLNKFKDSMAAFAVVYLPDENVSTTIPETIGRWLDNFGEIKDWCQWVTRKHRLENQGLECVCSYIENLHKSGTEASNAFLKGLYHKIILETIDSDDKLRMFKGMLFNEIISKYRAESSEFQELTKKELYCRLAANIPSQTMAAMVSSEMGILKRNISNGGRGTTIRKIIDQIPSLLPKLCPCMLMSPISVAQYVDISNDLFDIVVFDEASQMPTSEAVGAIARGRSLVVVGDPKQMPPTSFFSTSSVDEEEADIDDMESILDDCIAVSMPSRYLTWHYRSKHESLIAFSNSQYYDGKLYTFPSVDDRKSKVSLVKIEGTYDKGRTRSNKKEAEAVVKEIIARLSDDEGKQLSIGVVAFSKAQQTVIEDLFETELSKHPELEQKMQKAEEPVFIKNLENVQGDERDVILFSVGYGPDGKGNVSMNFGPLNNNGGERRLNVAVSRARYEMKVFSTLSPDQIDLKRSNAKGVAGLKKFLEFASHGILPVLKTNCGGELSPMMRDLKNILEDKGYKTDEMVGKSSFRIDLAVVDPENTDRYVLGILGDGESYYNTKTTRDREVCQPVVLGMLHWKIIRIWSLDWFENKEKVVNSVLDIIKNNSQQSKNANSVTGFTEKPQKDIPYKSFDVTKEPVVSIINEYEKNYSFAHIKPSVAKPDLERVLKDTERAEELLRRIIEIEQPVTNTYLYKRIATLSNLNRVTPRLQAMIDSLLINYYLDPLSDGRSMIYWQNKETAEGYRFYRINSKRDISETPIVELMNAAVYAIEQQISMSRDDLRKISSQLLGFTRRGVNVDLAADKAITALINQGKLKEEEGRIMAV